MGNGAELEADRKVGEATPSRTARKERAAAVAPELFSSVQHLLGELVRAQPSLTAA